MNQISFPCTLIALIFLAGCVPSLHGIYTENNIVFENSLLGTWNGENSEESWNFTQAEEKKYRLVHTDGKGNTGEFLVRLVTLDGTLFLDLYPKEPELENDFYQIHLLPVHTFFLVEQIQPTLKMSFLNPEWLGDYLEEYPDAVQQEFLKNDMIVLTDSTQELQKFLLKHIKTKDAFKTMDPLERHPNK